MVVQEVLGWLKWLPQSLIKTRFFRPVNWFCLVKNLKALKTLSLSLIVGTQFIFWTPTRRNHFLEPVINTLYHQRRTVVERAVVDVAITRDISSEERESGCTICSIKNRCPRLLACYIWWDNYRGTKITRAWYSWYDDYSGWTSSKCCHEQHLLVENPILNWKWSYMSD